MSKIKAELLGSFNNDLGVVNAARVSMDKFHAEFDKDSDNRLVNYLINSEPVPHFAPLTHGRETFILNPQLNIDTLSETDLAGLVFDDHGRKVRHSIFGWANLINKGYLYPDCASCIISTLSKMYPNVFTKLLDKDLYFNESYNEKSAIHVNSEETDKRFIDATFRLVVPIQVARQEFKHIVRFTRSERSKRYVSGGVEFLTVNEWRAKPEENIKQGSGGIHGNQWLPKLLYKGLCAASLGAYNLLIKLGYAPEQVRGLLLQNMMTQYIVTGSLAGFKNMMTQRLDGHAQLEIQQLAQQIDSQLSDRYGDIWSN